MKQPCSISVRRFALLVALAATVPNVTKASSKPSSGCDATIYNVHGIIANTDSSSSNNNPFQIQSDGGGAYPNPSSDTTTDYIGGFTCQWYLDTTVSGRTIGLTFAYPASNGATPPFAQAQVHAKIFSRCPDSSGNDLDWTAMKFNVAHECGSTIQFSYNGNGYTLKLNPDDAAGSTWIQVTCSGVNSSNGQCSMWSVTPIPGVVVNSSTGQSSAIGEVLQATRGGKTRSLGAYYLAFSYTITNP